MRTKCRLTYGLEDVTASSDATPSATYAQSFVKLPQLHEDVPLLPYATLEGDGFPLDGTRVLFPNSPASVHMGYWTTNLSGADGAFAAVPTLSVRFTKPHTSGGVTLVFSEDTEDYATDVEVVWYDSAGVELARKRMQNDAPTLVCPLMVQDYYQLRIYFYSVNRPYHFLKLSRLIYGFHCDLESGDNHLVSARMSSALDVTADTAPVSTLSFSFISDGAAFDILNPSGVYVLFQQQQWVKAVEEVDGKPIPVGMFYLETPKTNQGRTQMECVDLLGVLDQSSYLGGLWKTSITAKDLALAILANAGYDAGMLQMDTALAATPITGYLPVCTGREALQQLAFALGAFVKMSPTGKVTIFAPKTAPTREVQPRDKVQGQTVEQSTLVTGVEVYSHVYTENTTTRTLFSEVLEAGERTIAFSEPASDVWVSGATVLQSAANGVSVQVAANGTTVTIKGRPYAHSTVLAGAHHRAVLPAGAKANVVRVTGCTLTANPQALAKMLYARYQLRLTQAGTFFPLDVQLGDMVRVQTEGGVPITGYVTRFDADLAGGYLLGEEVTGA